MTVAPTHPAEADADEEAAAAHRSERARIARALGAAGALVWAGLYAMYVRVWVQPQDALGNLEGWARPVADGVGAAPFQYRFLVPELIAAGSDHLRLRAGFTLQAVDLLGLALGVVVLEVVLRRLDLRLWSPVVALYGAYLGLGVLWWGKFETMLAFGATTLGTAAVLGLVRRRGLALAAAVVLLIGTRTDLIVALGVAEAARWWFVDRRPAARRSAIALLAAGVGATLALKLAYPDAAYDEATGLIQLAHNLQPTNLLVAGAFLVPPLLPWVLAWRGPELRRRLAPWRATAIPLLALVAAELGSVLVIGRADEVRLFFPLAAALAILAVVGWRAAASLAAEPAATDA